MRPSLLPLRVLRVICFFIFYSSVRTNESICPQFDSEAFLFFSLLRSLLEFIPFGIFAKITSFSFGKSAWRKNVTKRWFLVISWKIRFVAGLALRLIFSFLHVQRWCKWIIIFGYWHSSLNLLSAVEANCALSMQAIDLFDFFPHPYVRNRMV